MTPAAVTGWGCVTAAGAGAAALSLAWDSGRRAIAPVRRFDTSALRVHLGAEMSGDAPAHDVRGAPELRAALAEALTPADLPRGARVLVLVATTKGFLDRGERVETGHRAADVGLPARCAAEDLRGRWGLDVVGATTVSTACTSGATVLALAQAALAADGGPDAVVCVGVDLLSDFVYRGFAALAAVDPGPCRPFDVGRAGMTPGEAVGVLLLERDDAARARGADVLGRVLAVGLGNDATHPTAPSRDGEGLAESIARALAASRTAAEDLGHVHAHGTATVFNDAMELRAYAAALGRAAARVPVTTLKGTIGHTFGAAGVVETIASFAAARAGRVAGVAGLARPDGDLDVLRAARALRSPRFLKTSAGFGGFHAAVVAEGCAA